MLLTEKYADLLESAKHPALTESQKNVMAVLLENQAKEDQVLSENTSTSDIAVFTPLFMPLARRVQPTLIANELVGVQPMSSPTGYMYTLRFRYTGMGANATDKTGGRISPVAGGQIIEVLDGSSISKGDVVKVGAASATVLYVEGNLILVSAKIGSAGAELNDASDVKITDIVNTFSNELTFRKVLKGYTGSLPTSAGELLGYDMSEIGFEVEQTGITVKTRKLRAAYTIEMYQDLKAMHGVNADEELMTMMAAEIQNEMDREVIEAVNSWSAPASDFTVGTSGSTRYEIESMAHLGIKIANEAREVARLTRMGAANVILCSPKVATVLEQLKGFKIFESDSKVSGENNTGAAVIGKFNGMKVIVDNFATSDYCTVLYKADNKRCIGIYAPYVMNTAVRYTDPASGAPGIILQSRYALVETPLNVNEKVFGRTFAVNFAGSFLA